MHNEILPEQGHPGCARHDVEVIQDGVDTRPGTTVRFDFASESGSPWFARTVVIRFSVKLYGLVGVRGLQEHQFSDFRRFSAESTIEFKQ